MVIKNENIIIEQYISCIKVIGETRSASFYFYTDNAYIDFVMSQLWHKSGNYIACASGLFHTLYFNERSFNKSKSLILDHIDGVGIDNRIKNLRRADYSKNSFNKQTRGYSVKSNRFIVRYRSNDVDLPYMTFDNEFDAVHYCFLREDKFQSDFKYNFFTDRRGDLDILDLELTDKISENEALYRHITRYALDNAWYYFRFGLQDYFYENYLEPPTFQLDSDGFMVHPVTKKRLCPL